MPATRLSALDASFLDVETPDSHMHVGWAATFTQPEQAPRRGFDDLREHIAARLDRAPRYRQKLAAVPFGMHQPLWVDDDGFDPARHIRRASSGDMSKVVDEVMSTPLSRDRPLWELWIAERLDDDENRIGVVGKAHHCMVDGLAAVEMALLLLDPVPVAPEPNGNGRWTPQRRPDTFERLTAAAGELMRDQLDLARSAGSLATTLGNTLLPIAPPSVFNRDSSPLRHLASLRRPLDDLQLIKNRFGVTVNDVILAASAGAIRRFVTAQGERPRPLKTMVPVSVRSDGDDLGNRISFVFVPLPCEEPDPVRRLGLVHDAMTNRKRRNEPEEADAMLQAAAHLPRLFQQFLSRAVSSPLMFNLVVSNIPGPREPLWMLGCELKDAYPIVPLAQGHGLSIGMTTVRDQACFGLYADRAVLPDADALARDLDAAIDELLEVAR
jgi:WS/DGAT/MGAT family acyltransferase